MLNNNVAKMCILNVFMTSNKNCKVIVLYHNDNIYLFNTHRSEVK